MSGAAGPTDADSAALLLQLQRCNWNCAAPKRCSLVAAGRATCQDSCYASRCAQGENCVQRQCGNAQQRPCDAQVFCFAASASVSGPSPLPLNLALAGFPTLSSFAATSAFAVDAATSTTATAGQPTSPSLASSSATSTTNSGQPACGGTADGSSSLMCEDPQVCVQDGPDTRASCVDLCDPRRCKATQVCRMRTPVACANPPCRKVATCK